MRRFFSLLVLVFLAQWGHSQSGKVVDLKKEYAKNSGNYKKKVYKPFQNPAFFGGGLGANVALGQLASTDGESPNSGYAIGGMNVVMDVGVPLSDYFSLGLHVGYYNQWVDNAAYEEFLLAYLRRNVVAIPVGGEVNLNSGTWSHYLALPTLYYSRPYEEFVFDVGLGVGLMSTSEQQFEVEINDEFANRESLNYQALPGTSANLAYRLSGGLRYAIDHNLGLYAQLAYVYSQHSIKNSKLEDVSDDGLIFQYELPAYSIAAQFLSLNFGAAYYFK